MANEPDELDSIEAALRSAREREERQQDGAGRRETELDFAWKLFDRICERDPGSVGDKAALLETFSECLATVRNPPADPLRARFRPSDADLAGDVPF